MQADTQMEFRLDIYPHHNELKHNYPIFSKEYNTNKVTEEICLSPGNYIIDIFGGPIQGINIIGGKEIPLVINL